MAIVKRSAWMLRNDHYTLHIREFSDGYWEVDFELEDGLAEHGVRKVPMLSGSGPITQGQRSTLNQQCSLILGSALALTGGGGELYNL